MTTSTRHRSKSPAVLLLVCIVLSVVILFELDGQLGPTRNLPGDEPPLPTSPDGGDVISEPIDVEFVMPPLATYSEVIARPLFSPSRLPASTKTSELPAEAVEQNPAQFILVGVAISTEGRLALLRRVSGLDVIRVSEGQVIDGWRVATITADRVVLRQGDVVEEVTLEDQIQQAPTQKRLRTKKQNNQ